MGESQPRRADYSAPATRRAAAEGLEDPFACGEEGRWVYLFLLDIIPSFPCGREKEGTAKRRARYLCELHRTAYYVAFGPHGPRAPVNPPGTAVKILTGISVLVGTAGLLYGGIRSMGVLSSSIFYDSVLTSTLPLFFFFLNAQLHRHRSRSARSGKRPPTSVRRNSKSTPSQVRKPFICLFHYFSIPVLSYLRGGDGVQVFHRRATLARALLHTSRFLSVSVSCVAYCSGYSVVIYPMFSSLVLRRHRVYTYFENKSYFYLTYCDRWQPIITLAC